MTQTFHSTPPILRFTNKNNYKFNQLIRHNFRIGIPENVNPKLSQYNFYFIAKQLALFMIVPDENVNYHVLVALLISQIYKFLVQSVSKTEQNQLSRPVYFLCDEFGNIPNIPHMGNIITIARSRNIFFQLIGQDLQQIIAKYGKEIANIIIANCALHIYLQTMDLETANRYVQMCGEKTVLQVTTSGKGQNKSQSETLKGHNLINMTDLMQLPTNHAIIFYSKEHPVKTKLWPWWKINNTNPKQNINNNLPTIKLINFQQDYYYDIKQTPIYQLNQLNDKIINSNIDILPQILSKEAITAGIINQNAELQKYEHDNSINSQEIKLSINKQLNRLQKMLNL